MFTAEQITAITSKARTGADYPQLVRDLKTLGVQRYDHFVADGSNTYYGADEHAVTIAAEQEQLLINEDSSAEKLSETIRDHQAGKTDYPTFCHQAAHAGVEKWVADLEQLEVRYIAKNGKTLLTEPIPAGDY